MQQFRPAVPWFPANAENYRFYLSMRPQGHQEVSSHPFPPAAPHRASIGVVGTASAVSPSLQTLACDVSGLSMASPITGSFSDASAVPPPPSMHPQPPQRIPLPRNNSFPPANANGRTVPRSTAASSTNNSPPPPAASNSSGPDGEPKPSLVMHLQKIHGLTKKRNYGLQASRAPFIRDETSSSPYPSHSVDPANGRPRRNTGVLASKSKRGDDPRRPRRGSVHVGLPESARVSSPESDSSTSVGAPSPTTTVAGVLASPTGPVGVGLQIAMPLSSPPLNLAEADYATAPPPPLWQSETLVQAAPANPAPAFADMLPPQQLLPQGQALSAAQGQPQVQRAHVRATAPVASSSYSSVPHGNADSPVAYSTTASAVGSSSIISQSSSTMQTIPATAPAPAPTTDDGDKPFIFYKEYEDALMPTAPPLFTPLSAATQPTSMAQYWPMTSADNSHILNPATSPGLLRGANPPPVYDVPMYDSPTYSQPTYSHVGPHVQPGALYVSEQSSSLQSWAGY